MKDMNGTEIVVGDKVVTARRQGSSSWLAQYDVVAVKDDRPVFEITQTPRKTGKTHKLHWPYQGGQDAILVIGKVTSVGNGQFTDSVGLHSMVEGNRD